MIVSLVRRKRIFAYCAYTIYNKSMDEENYMSTGEFARKYGYSQPVIQRLARSRKIPSISLNGRYRVPEHATFELMKAGVNKKQKKDIKQ